MRGDIAESFGKKLELGENDAIWRLSVNGRVKWPDFRRVNWPDFRRREINLKASPADNCNLELSARKLCHEL